MKIIQSPGYAKTIKTPTLVLLAEKEDVIDNEMTIRIANDMPNAEVETIAGARHEIYREKDEIRSQLIDKIINFFG